MERNNNYSLRGNNVLTRRRVKSMIYDTEAVDHFTKGNKGFWILDIFKRKIKKWIPLECPCRLLKHMYQGFIWVVKNKDTYHLLRWRQLDFQLL